MSQPVTVRREVKTVVETTDEPMRSDVISDVAAEVGVSEDEVEKQLDRMEREGFAYLVNGVVKLP